MVIFLDIDGVMVPIKSWQTPPMLQDGFPDFSVDAVKCLNSKITDETVIVLTTSHRFNYKKEEWIKIFKTRGVVINNIQYLPVGNRKDEICKYINDDMEYIIIDDDKSLNDLPKKIKEKLILTSPMIGLK